VEAMILRFREGHLYSTVLIIHSWLRWAALLFGVAATFNAFRHRADAAERAPGQRWDWLFMLALDLQVLFGLLLYFGLSPFTREAMNNVGMALHDPALRFWAITHVAMMFVALVAVRAGRVFAMGERTSRARRNGRYVCFGIAVLAMVVGVPWPGLAYARPLFRI
jgi:drug/metabolite transporter (DMT)-like permease